MSSSTLHGTVIVQFAYYGVSTDRQIDVAGTSLARSSKALAKAMGKISDFKAKSEPAKSGDEAVETTKAYHFTIDVDEAIMLLNKIDGSPEKLETQDFKEKRDRYESKRSSLGDIANQFGSQKQDSLRALKAFSFKYWTYQVNIKLPDGGEYTPLSDTSDVKLTHQIHSRKHKRLREFSSAEVEKLLSEFKAELASQKDEKNGEQQDKSLPVTKEESPGTQPGAQDDEDRKEINLF